MTIRLQSGFAMLFASLVFSSAQAQEAPLNTIPVVPLDSSKPDPISPKFGVVIGGGGEFGGDKLATVFFQDGSSQNVRAGQGITVFVGGTARLSELSPWSLRATAGYKYNTTAAANSNIDFGRVPVELIGSYHFKNGIRGGIGPVYHTAIKLNGDPHFDDVKFRNAVGFKVEAGWRWIVASYTNIKYRVKGIDGSADASSFGIGMVWEFGQP